MARETIRHQLGTDEKYTRVCDDNKNLLDEFVEYLQSVGRSELTIKGYVSDIKILYCWALEYNSNKFFIDFGKRDFMKYQNYLLNTLKLSSNRIRRQRSSMSSMANYVENMMDDIYPNFRNIVNKLEAPAKQMVREKTILEDEQCQQLLDYLIENKKYQMAVAFALGLSSGRRKAEIPRLKVSHIKEEYLKYGSLYKTPEKIKTKGKGGGKYIYVYILKTKFKPYFDLWMEERKRLGVPEDMDEMFVVKRKGEWVSAPISTFDSWAIKFSEVLGVDFYWHSLRHAFTTEMVKNNIPASVIKDIISWESTDMVDLYTDIDVDDKLGEYFGEEGIKKVESKGLSDL